MLSPSCKTAIGNAPSREMGAEESAYHNLYRRMRITCSARFNASDRLQQHQKFSLWTVSLFSVGLVLLPLLSVFGISVNFPRNVMDMVQVIAAVVILVFSILLSVGNSPKRAEKMHSCGLEINALCRELYPLLGKETDPQEYNDLSKRYEEILKRYENHDPIDYERAKLLKERGFYNVGWLGRLSIHLRYATSCSHYAALLIAEIIFIYLAVK